MERMSCMQTESAVPDLCCFDESTVVQRVRHAYGLCPVDVTLNPPEEARHYSSVWDGDAIGSGHARSMLDLQPRLAQPESTPGGPCHEQGRLLRISEAAKSAPFYV